VSAQTSQPEALQAVRAAVAMELQTNHADRSDWMYRDEDYEPGRKALYNAVETPEGELRRMIALNGKPVDEAQAQAEAERLRDFVHDTGAQAKARKNGQHDGAQAEELLKELPDEFIWTLASQTPDSITLDFAPNPKFSPPDIQSRVFAAMGGQMIIDRETNHIRTLRGRLLSDIVFGLAIFGKLDKGGSFQVERRQVGGGHWQITETHVHIGGHALFFKTIGSQEDEVKTDWKPSPDKTLVEAAERLGVN
jgi:hypothetical protein